MRSQASGHLRAASLAVLAALTLGSSCDRAVIDRMRSTQKQGDARVGGAVVSTVDGLPITVSEVQKLVSVAGLAPDVALRKLQAERLLMLEAERRNFSRGREVDWVARQARVQALLEAVTSSVVIGDEQIAQAYEKATARFEVPERRVVVHILAMLPKEPTSAADAAAHAFATDMIKRLASADDVQAVLASARENKASEFEVTAESLPPLGRDAGIVPAFLEAMFGLPAPGVVPKPVKTPYGWHAVRVMEIQPAAVTPYDEAAEQLRAELALARKNEIVEELIETARDRHGVVLAKDLREALAKIEL